MSIINRLIRGNKLFQKYQRIHFKEELNESITHGQKPEVLFICCCDSRITTDFMFTNRPGDLFLLRNIGNFVPPYDKKNDFLSVAAAIEYAVDILKVSHVIVCGHSHCGACESLYKDIDEHDYIKQWLHMAQPVKEKTLLNEGLYRTKEELYRATEKNSVIFQLQNLMTYPTIEKQVFENKLTLHGWYYDLEDGSIAAYDKNKHDFVNLC